VIYVRQDRPGFITIDFSKEPKFDSELHGPELALGLFTIESTAREIVTEDSGQLGHVLDYISNWLRSQDWEYELDPVLEHALALFRQEASLVARANVITLKQIATSRLAEIGIQRQLLPHQLKAVRHALGFNNAANFSVPGSGKTTSALAVYALLRSKKVIDRLLVIGPASSFAPWENEFQETFGQKPSVARLIGTSYERSRVLHNLDGVNLVLSTYQMAYREKERLIATLRAARYLLILDEAHHVKNINLGPWARTVLDLAPYAERRMILTGTPAPRSLMDVWSQFTFLWPSQTLLGNRVQFEQRLTFSVKAGEELRQRLKPFFIRTKKSDLRLPKPIPIVTKIPYQKIPARQRVIIRLLEQRTLQEAKKLQLGQSDIAILRRWRKARTLRLLQAASNPMLLTNALPDVGEFGASMSGDPAIATLLRDYLKHEVPAKIAFVVTEVRELVAEGKKVVVWATFVENILLLERQLEDLHPLKIYGDVPAYNEEDDPNFENRERNIAEFKSRNDRPLLIANPAACSESVSLHIVCQDAIYLERTFNCGQFLQSMDRIHRVGMPLKKPPHYHIPILQCAVEQVVDRRLRTRQQVLYKFLDDDMPVFGFDDDSFLADRDDDLEEILNDLLREIASNANKGINRTRRRGRASG